MGEKMKRITQAIAVCGFAAFVLASCQDKNPTAKKLDELKETASQAVQDIQRNTSDAVKDLQQGASDALEGASNAADDLLKNINR
jgi:predicted translin family RNA/ssDNA-binding protein